MDEYFSKSITDDKKTANMELAFGQNELGRTLLDDLGFAFNPGEASAADAYFIQNSTGRRFDLKEFRKYLNDRDTLYKSILSQERNSLFVMAAANTEAIGKMMYPTGRPSSLEQYMALDAGLSPTGAGLSANMKVPGAAQAAGWRNPAADALTRMDQERDWWEELTDPNKLVASAQNPSALPGSEYFINEAGNAVEAYSGLIDKLVSRYGMKQEMAKLIVANAVVKANKNMAYSTFPGDPVKRNEYILEEINSVLKDKGIDREVKSTGDEIHAHEEKVKLLESKYKEAKQERERILKDIANVRREHMDEYKEAGWIMNDDGSLTNVSKKDRASQGFSNYKLKKLDEKYGVDIMLGMLRKFEEEPFPGEDYTLAGLAKELYDTKNKLNELKFPEDDISVERKRMRREREKENARRYYDSLTANNRRK